VEEARLVLSWSMSMVLRLLHPMMPFVTETLWDKLGFKADAATTLVMSSWPDLPPSPEYSQAEREMEVVFAVVAQLRNAIATHSLGSPRTLQLSVDGASKEQMLAIHRHAGVASVTAATTHDSQGVEGGDMELVVGGVTVRVGRADVDQGRGVDVEAERKRVNKLLAKTSTGVLKLHKTLHSPGFLERAAPDMIDKVKTKLATLEEQQRSLMATLERLESRDDE